MSTDRTPLALPGSDCASCAPGPSTPPATSGRGRLAAGGTVAGSPVVALAGNPNTGKSTVFNALTGMRQHVGNWSGSTVARAEGTYEFAGESFTVIDLPGTYSLLSASRDEDLARDFLLFGDPAVSVVVVDATRLQGNLHLVLQVLQVTGRVVVALNLMDEARRRGIELDVRHLTRELGVPVVPMAARRGRGVPALLRRICDVASGTWPAPPVRAPRLSHEVSRAVDKIETELLATHPGLPHARWLALRLLEGDPGVARMVSSGRFEHPTAMTTFTASGAPA